MIDLQSMLWRTGSESLDGGGNSHIPNTSNDSVSRGVGGSNRSVVTVGTMVDQHAGHLGMALHVCPMQRCTVEVVALVGIGVVINLNMQPTSPWPFQHA
jgi:hypothetical protein